MKRSDLAFKLADGFPRVTDLLMKTMAPHLPPHWILAHIAARRNLRIPLTARLFNGMKMTVTLGDNVGAAICRYGCCEPETVKAAMFHLQKHHVFFDLGAHVGQYTLLASPLCRLVHSFEAVPDTFDLLCRNIRINRLANVQAENLAVSDRCGSVTIYEGTTNNLNLSSLAPMSDGQRTFSVAAVSIDHYCATHNVVPDVMKIDVEGAEISVLRGAAQVLREKHPTLLVEIAELNLRRFGFTAADLISELKGFGYSLSRIDNDSASGSELVYYNVVATAQPPRGNPGETGDRKL